MANINHIMKQAKQMQTKLSALHKELEKREIESTAGGGAIKLKINGKQEITELKISPECVDPSDVIMLEDLIKAAVNKGIQESQAMVSHATSKITGGASIPGLF